MAWAPHNNIPAALRNSRWGRGGEGNFEAPWAKLHRAYLLNTSHLAHALPGFLDELRAVILLTVSPYLLAYHYSENSKYIEDYHLQSRSQAVS